MTDPSAISARVDGVLLTIRLSKRTRNEASRATELLRTLGANLLGVVVNGIGKTGGYGYGYGAYNGYGGYQYNYNYNSQNDYGAERDNPYYSDDDEKETPRVSRRRSGVQRKV